MSRYTQKADGVWYNKDTGLPEEPPSKWKEGDGFPRFSSDTWNPYRSMITGEVVQGNRSRREELARAADKGMVPYERIDGHPGGLINDKFAARGGRRTSEAAKDWAAKKKAATTVRQDANGAILSE